MEQKLTRQFIEYIQKSPVFGFHRGNYLKIRSSGRHLYGGAATAHKELMN